MQIPKLITVYHNDQPLEVTIFIDLVYDSEERLVGSLNGRDRWEKCGDYELESITWDITKYTPSQNDAIKEYIFEEESDLEQWAKKIAYSN